MWRRRVLIAYVACLHIVPVLMVFRSDLVQRLHNRIVDLQELPRYYDDMVLFHGRRDGNVPPGAILLIGDSLVQGLCAPAVSPLAVNYGIGGDTTRGVLKRLPVYKSFATASLVVLSVGLNDMRWRSNAEIAANYRAIISAIPCRVIINAVLPIDPHAPKRWKGITQPRIEALNEELRDIARQYRCDFIDPGPLLVDSCGCLRDCYHTGDGVHLNSNGNAVWIQCLRQAL